MGAKKVLVLGATGGTGQQVVTQGLKLGFEVTAFVRNPQGLSATSDRLRVLTGNVLDDDHALAAAVKGQDAVISTLGVGKSFHSGGLIAGSATRVVRAMEAAGVRRLIWTSAFGVGDTIRDTPLVPRIFIRLLLQDVYRDKEAGEAVIDRSTLDWTVVHPVGLSDRPGTGTYRVGEHRKLRGFPTIARADVASCLLALVDDVTLLNRHVLVTN